MVKILQYYIFLLIILLVVPQAQSQTGKRIKYQAKGALENGTRNGETYRKLIDHVVFKQENTTVYCDSALFFPKRNTMEAFGRVRIVDDSVTITSRRLVYKGNERKAELREKVVYTRGERRLYTDFLNYDLDGEVAHYFNDGKLQDMTNTLTSEIGYFHAKQNFAQFFNDVVLIAPDYTLKTDTLKYNTSTKIAYTSGRTEIITEDGTTLHAKGGEFRTVYDQSQFIEGTVETDDYTLDGDELFFDDLKKYYKAIGNVSLTAKENDVIITGEEGYYDKDEGISKIYGNPLMKRILKEDTFYLAADTLVAIESEFDSLKRILAYHDIKIFKKGLQGIADSMAYFRKDSIIFFYKDPVMWNNNNQVLGDTINLEISKGEIERMNLLSNAFMISEDTIQNYNQIKGRTMKSYFENNQIRQIDVDGNGEILYFALEKGDSVLMGLNKIFCAKMKIYLKNQEITNFRVYNKPDAQLIPPHELTPEVQQLENFAWRIDERPLLYDVAPYLDPDYDPTQKKKASGSEKPKEEKDKDQAREKLNSIPKPTINKKIPVLNDGDKKQRLNSDTLKSSSSGL